MDWEVAGKDKGAAGGAAPKSPNRKGKKMKKRVIAAVVIVAAIALLNIQSCIKSQPKNLSWPTSGLATMLPDPPTKKGEVNTDSDKSFSADIAGVSDEQYKSYVESCKEKGFTTDAETGTDTYEAYSNEGYKLRLTHYSFSSDNEMSISLDAPIVMGTLTWPTSGVGSNAPAPTSKKGKVDSDSSTWFHAYVGDTDKSAYSTYVDACIAAGFDVDYHKGDTTFYADRSDGVHINVEYKGFNTISVTVKIQKSDSSDSKSDSSATESETKSETSTSDASTSKSEDASTAATAPSDSGASSMIDSAKSSAKSLADKGKSLLKSITGNGETYDSIYEEYSKKLNDMTPGKIDEFNSEADASDGSISSLAEISNNKVADLAVVCTEGIQKMAEVMYRNGDDYSVYEENASKLYSVYEDCGTQIYDAYLARAA